MTVQQTFRVYVDGVFDLFHSGHENVLRKAKAKAEEVANGKKVILLAGVCGNGVTDYKRETIMTLSERCAAVANSALVDEVEKDCPLQLTQHFMQKKEIDLVVHGDDFDQKKRDYYYGAAIECDRYAEVPYTPSVSSSQLITEAKMHGKFSIDMSSTLIGESELVKRIQARTWEALKVPKQ